MEVLLEDIKRTLGAKRIYLPGSDEQRAFVKHQQSQKRAVRGSPTIGDLESAVQGLGIVDSHDSAVDMRSAFDSNSSRRSRLDSSSHGTSSSGGSDKENRRALKGKAMMVSEGRETMVQMTIRP
jgi:hypothetical protein